MAEAIGPTASIRRADRRRPIAALLQADVAMSGAIIARTDLELHPRGWKLSATLHAALKAFREADEGTLSGAHVCWVGWLVELCAGSAVAVPEIVVEVVLLLLR